MRPFRKYSLRWELAGAVVALVACHSGSEHTTSADSGADARWTVHVKSEAGLFFTEVDGRPGVIIPKEDCVELETVPGAETECWTPTGADIAAFESGLDDYLTKHPLPSPSCRTRQYVGVVGSSERTLEVTFVCDNAEPETPDGWRAWPRIRFDARDAMIHYGIDSKRYRP
jgi:hypothetical protein